MSVDPFLRLPETVKPGWQTTQNEWVLFLCVNGMTRLQTALSSSVFLFLPYSVPRYKLWRLCYHLQCLVLKPSACIFVTFMQCGAGCWSQSWSPAQITHVLGMQEGSESKPECRIDTSTTIGVPLEQDLGNTKGRFSHEWARKTLWI